MGGCALCKRRAGALAAAVGGPIMGRVAGGSRVGAAWLTAYVAAGGLAGFVLARRRAPFRIFNEGDLPARCWPELGLFDMIQTRCASGGWDVVCSRTAPWPAIHDLIAS